MTAQDIQPPAKYRLRVADYLTLDRSGAFEGLRTELIEGEVIVMSPQTRRHMFVKAELAYRIRRALEEIGNTLFVGLEGSVEMGESDMPEPDIVLTSEPDGEGYIPLSSVALAVEVSATTLKFDLERKGPLYARHGVPEYWVVDVKRGVVHQMSSPENGEYGRYEEIKFGSELSARTIDGLCISTERL